MNELEKFMKKLDPAALRKLQGFAASAEGQKIISQFSGKSSEDVMKKLNALSEQEKNALISKLSADPSVINKIKEML